MPDQHEFPGFKTKVKYFKGDNGESIAIRFYQDKAPTPDTEDYKCTHCARIVETVSFQLWSNDGKDMAILHFECAMEAGIFQNIRA